MSIDGTDAAPASAHTYDNAVFLPVADRYLNFGGAVYGDGGAYRRPSESDPTLMRNTGPYLFDPSKANSNKVGGTTGSHVKRVGQFPEIVGGEMWQNRDLPRFIPEQYSLRGHINGCTAYSSESDEYDVVYVASRRGGGTGLALHRYQITDIQNSATDQYELAGIFWSSPAAQTTCGYDPIRRVFLKTGINTNPFQFWDLRPERLTNRDQKVLMENATGGSDFLSWIQSYTEATKIPLSNCGLDYDQKRVNFLLWCGGQEVWRITPPESLSQNGWSFSMEPLGSGESPPLNVGTGILGKWEYIPGFDVFIGLENIVHGNIWVYKPIGWIAPGNGSGGTSNKPPEISLILPAPGENVLVNTEITIAALASDIDGSITSVKMKVNGNTIGELFSGPYSVNWKTSTIGVFTITAEAVDNSGAVTLAEAVTVNVISDGNNGGGGGGITTTLLQRDSSNFGGVSDVYLSSYHKNNNFGSRQEFKLYYQRYTPMIQFRIFSSEGGLIPDNAVIESATLSFYKEIYNHVIALHAILIPWKEEEATWNQASNGLGWNIAGAGSPGFDYESIPDAIADAPWNAGWIDFDVTDRLRAISANLSENYGWRFISMSGNNNLKKFYTSEETDMDRHPKLEIRWKMP